MLETYFAPPTTPEDAILRRIKGNYRRQMVERLIAQAGLAAVPSHWLTHNLPENLKGDLQSRGAVARGGEDLPDFLEGEVEIARLSLLESEHGEVTSLRARPDTAGGILLRMVDEYGIELDLPFSSCPAPLSAREILRFFAEADPSPAETTNSFSLSSDFYSELDALATEVGFKE